MPGYRLEVPYLILIQPIRFPLFMIDFNGPAMASDAGEPSSLPIQLVRDEIGGRIREISLAMIDDQALLAKVMDVMGFAVTVIGLLFSFVGDGQFTKDRSTLRFDGFMVFLLEMRVKGVEALWLLF